MAKPIQYCKVKLNKILKKRKKICQKIKFRHEIDKMKNVMFFEVLEILIGIVKTFTTKHR